MKANESRFRELERRAVEVIETMTNAGMKYSEDEEVVDVCQAIKEMREESKQIGKRDGVLEEAQKSARNFYRMGLSVEKVAEGVEYDVDTVKKWLNL